MDMEIILYMQSLEYNKTQSKTTERVWFSLEKKITILLFYSFKKQPSDYLDWQTLCKQNSRLLSHVVAL